jgi:hypothetical protein
MVRAWELRSQMLKYLIHLIASDSVVSFRLYSEHREIPVLGN